MSNHPLVANARQKGTIIALEVKVEEGSTYFSSIKDDAYEFFTKNELLIRPLGNVIFLNPPYCITPSELEFAYGKIEEFLNSRK